MIELKRVSLSNKGTFGVLLSNGIPLCVTLEDPWNDNKIGESCIPAGVYQCRKHFGEKYKNVWILENVPGRSAILIHAGNTIDDTRGCILVGSGFSGASVINSKSALDKLRTLLPNTFEIKIT